MLLLAWTAAAGLCGCDKREREDEMAAIARKFDNWTEVDEFWNSARQPGGVMRSIGVNDSLGVFVFWETSDIPRMSSEPRCRGSCPWVGEKIELWLPFDLKHGMRIETLDGVECMMPEDMTMEAARTSGWLLIRRKEASFDRPFHVGENELTVFDVP